MFERRRLTRYPVNKRVKIRLEGAADYRDCILNNLNLQGLEICCLKEKLSVDKIVKLDIIFDREANISFEAWVAWYRRITKHNACGLYFTRISDQDKEKIHQFLSHGTQSHGLEETGGRGGEKMEKAREDRRVFERFSAKLALSFLDLNNNKEGQASTQDISAKGVGFMTEAPLATHTPLEMWLKVADKGEPIYVRGEVVWFKMVAPNKYRAGVDLEKANLMGLSRVLRTI